MLGGGRAARVCLALAVFCGPLRVDGLLNEKAECTKDKVVTEGLFACGAFHTCTANGSIVEQSQPARRSMLCFGWQEFGQAMPPPIDLVKKVGAGARHTCATDSYEVAHCWGSNMYGQLDRPRPFTEVNAAGQRVPSQPCNYCKVGDFNNDTTQRTFGKCEDNSLNYYAVENPFCQPECMLPEGRRMVHIGWTRWNKSSIEKLKPVFRADYRHDCRVDQIAAGGQHTCLLYGIEGCNNCNYGYVRCFGNNLFGQTDVPECPDGEPPKESWVRPPMGSKLLPTGWLACSDGSVPYSFTKVSSGMFHTCAIREYESTIMCWGDNRFNQSSPPAGRFIEVSCGAYHSCGITVDGLVRCWGNNSYGESDGHELLLEKGILDGDGGEFAKVACGAVHTCGIYVPSGMSLLANTGNTDTGAKVVCWGANYAGQSTPPPETSIFMTAVSVGWEHSCGVSLDDHKLICWGSSNWDMKKSTDMDLAAASVPGCVSVCTSCINLAGAASLRPNTSIYLLSLLATTLLVIWGRPS